MDEFEKDYDEDLLGNFQQFSTEIEFKSPIVSPLKSLPKISSAEEVEDDGEVEDSIEPAQRYDNIINAFEDDRINMQKIIKGKKLSRMRLKTGKLVVSSDEEEQLPERENQITNKAHKGRIESDDDDDDEVPTMDALAAKHANLGDANEEIKSERENDTDSERVENDNNYDGEVSNCIKAKRQKVKRSDLDKLKMETERLVRSQNIVLESKTVKKDMTSFLAKFKKIDNKETNQEELLFETNQETRKKFDLTKISIESESDDEIVIVKEVTIVDQLKSLRKSEPVKPRASWKDERLERMRKARAIEARKRNESKKPSVPENKGKKEEEIKLKDEKNEIFEQEVEPEEEEEEEDEMTCSSSSESSSDENESEASNCEEDEEIKVFRRTRNVVAEEDDQNWIDEFEATVAPVDSPSRQPNPIFHMLQKMKRTVDQESDNTDEPEEVSQIPDPSFESTNFHNDGDSEGGFKSLHWLTVQPEDDYADGESVVETMTERSMTPASNVALLTDSQQESLLQKTKDFFDPDILSIDGGETGLDKDLSLIDALARQKSGKLKRLIRAQEIVSDDAPPLLPKSINKSPISKRTDFVEQEAEVEEDEFMNAGGADGELDENNAAIREELAAFIDEDEKVLSKLSIKELERLLEFHNQQMQAAEMKQTKLLVRDIATGKILDKRKHGGDTSRTDLEKFGRAADEEEDENALKELDDAEDYGMFGDIITKYVQLRKEAARKNQLRKRKRQNGQGLDEDEAEQQRKSLFQIDDEDCDWTNERQIGTVQITPGISIETDMDRLEEKLKRESLLNRMHSFDNRTDVEQK